MGLKIPLVIFIYWFETLLFAAEAGMPQLDSKYWLSQSFWLILIFLLLYLSLSKFFIPKIKDNLDDREKKIKDNLDEAKDLILEPGDKFHIYRGLRHQMVAIEPSELFEFSTQHFDEDSYRVIKGD